MIVLIIIIVIIVMSVGKSSSSGNGDDYSNFNNNGENNYLDGYDDNDLNYREEGYESEEDFLDDLTEDDIKGENFLDNYRDEI